MGISAQYVIVNEPADCQGALRFGPTADWGAALTSDIWTGNLVIVDDGSANPTEACQAVINGSEVSGNIAFIDRGNCNFSLKALNAQNAGAVAVVIANQMPGNQTIVMGAGNFATQVTIPVVMISYEDGQIIKDKLEANTTVNISLGNLSFENDLGMTTETVVAPGYSTYPANQLEAAGNFEFTPGAGIVNNGSNDAASPVITAKINHDAGSGGSEIYSESVNDLTIVSGDTSVYTLAPFDPSATGKGTYTYEYNVKSDNNDEVEYDNTFSNTLEVSDNVICKARWDKENNRPMRTNGFTIAGGGSIEMLSGFEFPHSTNLRLDSVLFHVSTQALSLADMEISVFLYKWDDANDDGGYSADEVQIAGFAVHKFGAGETETEAWVTVEIENFNDPGFGVPIPEDGARYVVGTQYQGVESVFFGFDEGVDLEQFIDLEEANQTYNDIKLPYSQSTSFTAFGADFDAIGLFTDTWFCSSTALYVNPIPNSVDQLSADEAKVNLFPNPATSQIQVDVELSNLANQKIGYQILDMQGRTIFTDQVRGVSKDNRKFEVSQLPSGTYELIISADAGVKTVSFIVE